MKIQTMKELETEMRAVARGEVPVPPDAALPSAESAEALRSVEPIAADKTDALNGLAEGDPIHFSPEDQRRLVELILNPPPLSSAMERARAHHRRLAKPAREHD